MPPDHGPAFAASAALLAVVAPSVLLVISYLVHLGIGLWRAPVPTAETGDASAAGPLRVRGTRFEVPPLADYAPPLSGSSSASAASAAGWRIRLSSSEP